jgi:hypothetical protein
MMMMLGTSVECSAKIAMRALRPRRDTTGLLPDIDQTRRIFLALDVMHLFRSHVFIPHGVPIEAIMEQRMVKV